MRPTFGKTLSFYKHTLRPRPFRCTFFAVARQSPKLRIVGALLIAAVLGATGCERLGLDEGPTAPSGPPAAGTAINYAALGASDVIGIGSSVPCLPYSDCDGGTGYVFVAGRQLRAAGYTVRVDTLGIPTAVLSRRLAELGTAYGRTILGNVLDQELPFIRTDVTLVTIFIGANDVNVITAAVGGGAGGADPTGYVDQQVRAFGEEFATLVDGVRRRVPSARLVVLNVPNVGALPLLADATRQQRQAAQRAAVGITRTVINPLASSTLRVMDLMCEPRLYQTANLSSDGFHPNDTGYALLAAEVVRAVTSSSYPAPSGSCPQMTIVP